MAPDFAALAVGDREFGLEARVLVAQALVSGVRDLRGVLQAVEPIAAALLAAVRRAVGVRAS